MELDEKQCTVCSNWFLTSAIDTEGRCTVCSERELIPGATKEQDQIKGPEQRRQELKSLVRELMLELQEEKRVEREQKKLKKRPCKKCGEEFMPRAPANTICIDCQNAERATRQRDKD